VEPEQKVDNFQKYCEKVKRITDLALKRRERIVRCFLKYEKYIEIGNYEIAEAYVFEMIKHQTGQDRLIKKIEDLKLKYELGQFE
jgi:uncharacterized protein HemY